MLHSVYSCSSHSLLDVGLGVADDGVRKSVTVEVTGRVKDRPARAIAAAGEASS